MEVWSRMFERFTDEARRVLVLAQEEARALAHDFIGTEHLLLGILRHGKGPAPEALNVVGVTLDGARSRIAQAVQPRGTTAVGSPPFSSRAKMKRSSFWRTQDACFTAGRACGLGGTNAQ